MVGVCLSIEQDISLNKCVLKHGGTYDPLIRKVSIGTRKYF